MSHTPSRLVPLFVLMPFFIGSGCQKPHDHSDHAGDGVDHDIALNKVKDDGKEEPETDPNFEVWLVDQSNSLGKTFGGAIHIYAGSDLSGNANKAPPALAVIDLGAAAADLCVASTGAPPVRPHMIFFNTANSHAIVSFVASGHVLFLDARTRTPVGCLRSTPGAAGARQAHAAIPAPNDAYVLVANQNGKLLERIDTNYATNTFAWNTPALLDLAQCTTPNGLPCQSPDLRSDNAPICPVIEAESRLAFLTLRGGGMFVVDATTTPMSIRAEYDQTQFGKHGCGGIQVGSQIFLDAGGGTAANLHGFNVYRVPATGYTEPALPNLPARTHIFSDETDGRDAHGMVMTKHDRYLWVLDRGLKMVEVFDVTTDERVNTFALETATGDTPTPDLADRSPSGNRIFFSMRGPNPLSGDPHVASGSLPGLGVLKVTTNGQSGSIKTYVPIHNVDAAGVERADPHGVRVRRIPAN